MPLGIHPESDDCWGSDGRGVAGKCQDSWLPRLIYATCFPALDSMSPRLSAASFLSSLTSVPDGPNGQTGILIAPPQCLPVFTPALHNGYRCAGVPRYTTG